MKYRASVRVAGYLLLFISLAAFVETASFVVAKYVLYPRAPDLFYVKPQVNRTEFQRYMQNRDSLLGWPSLAQAEDTPYNSTSSRFIPSFPNPVNECISLYGDSYTYGDEVGDADAWSNVLSEKLNCRVANYGIGGYGTDQAYLRFLKTDRDQARVTILGIFPYDILRNVNQYRYFLTGGEVLSLKPRFVMKNGKLSLIPILEFGYDGFMRAISKPEDFFQHEIMLPDSAYGPATLSFPYTAVVLKQLLSVRIRNWILGRPSWIEFLAEDHPSQALPVTTAIAKEFTQLAFQRGKESFVIIFPTTSSYRFFVDTGEIATQPLIDNLKRVGVDVLDTHRSLLKRLGTRSYCEILTDYHGCSGHYNAEGNKIIADIVYHELRNKKYFKR